MSDQTPPEQTAKGPPAASEASTNEVTRPQTGKAQPSKDDQTTPEQVNTKQVSTEPCPSCGNSPGHKFSCPELKRNCVMPFGMRKGTKSTLSTKDKNG